MIKTFLPFLILLFLLGCDSVKKKETPYVIMLSVDGFRWDYTDKVPTPNFDRISKNGVKAEYVKSSFPTKTFPNHYSMATGLYPDNHGIVLNSFYDPVMERYYDIMDRSTVEDGSFYGGEPIWVTAEKQGMITGSYFWVGSEAEIDGTRPTYWKNYEHYFPLPQRIDSVISWLEKPEEIRPNLILWYMHEPDNIGHNKGPDSKELESQIIYLDSLVGVFLDKVEVLPFADQINVIVTSDHGMGNISEERVVILEDHINMNWIEIVQGYNPNFVIKTKEGYVDSVYNQLARIQHISAWQSENVPPRLNYGKNPRTLDIVVVADSAWSVVLNKGTEVNMGAHGYDNTNPDMRTIFLARGPAFKENYLSPAFENVDIYPLIAHILALEPATCDGSFDHIKAVLKE